MAKIRIITDVHIFRDYMSRLSCMSSCFSLYTPLSPHHNLARYCMQASCPATQDPAMHQVSGLSCPRSLDIISWILIVSGSLVSPMCRPGDCVNLTLLITAGLFLRVLLSRDH